MVNCVLAGKVNFPMEQIRATGTQQDMNSEGVELESCSGCQT
jgi:hypothetical protein